MSWQDILKRVKLKRAIGIPVMQEIFDSGEHPQVIDTSSDDYTRLQTDFLTKYAEKANEPIPKGRGHSVKGPIANAVRHRPDRFKTAIMAYARQVGFHFIYTAPDGQVYDPAGNNGRISKGKGERHFYMDGDTPIEWTGPTHKHPDGTLMSGKEHIEGKSKKLLHLNELSKDALKKVGKTSYSKSRSAFTDRD